MGMKKRPHIIILNPDEMRWDTMGHMGNAGILPEPGMRAEPLQFFDGTVPPHPGASDDEVLAS